MSGKWTYADLPSLEGKIAIVTGSTGGIGLETAAKLASKGATVIVPGRNPEKVKAAVEEIRQKAGGQGKIVPEAMDQMDLASVDAFAQRVLANYEKLDILVNNAGTMAPKFQLSKDGIESQWVTNHFSHFLLTSRLIPLLAKATPDARVVNVSSMGHALYAKNTTGEWYDLKKISDPELYKGNEYKFYGETKAANIMHARELQRRLEAAGYNHIYVTSLHPGVVTTNLGNNAKWIGSWGNKFIGLFKFTGMALDPEQGAVTQTYLAAAPEVAQKGYKGEYFVPQAKLSESTKATQDPALQKKLWEWSEKVLAEKGFQVKL